MTTKTRGTVTEYSGGNQWDLRVMVDAPNEVLALRRAQEWLDNRLQDIRLAREAAERKAGKRG